MNLDTSKYTNDYIIMHKVLTWPSCWIDFIEKNRFIIERYLKEDVIVEEIKRAYDEPYWNPTASNSYENEIEKLKLILKNYS